MSRCEPHQTSSHPTAGSELAPTVYLPMIAALPGHGSQAIREPRPTSSQPVGVQGLPRGREVEITRHSQEAVFTTDLATSFCRGFSSPPPTRSQHGHPTTPGGRRLSGRRARVGCRALGSGVADTLPLRSRVRQDRHVGGCRGDRSAWTPISRPTSARRCWRPHREVHGELTVIGEAEVQSRVRGPNSISTAVLSSRASCRGSVSPRCPLVATGAVSPPHETWCTCRSPM